MTDKKQKTAFLLVRLGVAFAFIYPAVAAFLDPAPWIGYLPAFTRKIAPAAFLLNGWGFFETVIALWILSGKKIFIPSVLASLSLAGLIFFNFSEMDVIFRDVAILAATIALAIQNFPQKS